MMLKSEPHSCLFFQLLAKLLKSKNPDDLQAANRLIKNMVKQDTERMEKVSRRINELETIHTNVKLLSEMMTQFNPKTTTQSEKEMMKVEIYNWDTFNFVPQNLDFNVQKKKASENAGWGG